MFDSATIIVMAAGAALLAGVTALRYPRLCLGVLFLAASFSRDTVQTPLGTMRPEMPAVLVVAVVLLGRTDAVQFRRSIGGEHHEGNVRQIGFGHRSEQFRGRGTARDDNGDGTTRGESATHGKEGRAALVNSHVQRHLGAA